MYSPGDFYRFCEVCGFRYLASETTKRWDNLIVCREDFETRHPQDFVRGRRDSQNVPNPRPEPADVFVGPASPLETEDGDGFTPQYFLTTEDGDYIEADGL